MNYATYTAADYTFSFYFTTLLVFRVQYVKDLLLQCLQRSGTAGLEPVLAAGLDTLIPVYRFIEQNCRTRL